MQGALAQLKSGKVKSGKVESGQENSGQVRAGNIIGYNFFFRLKIFSDHKLLLGPKIFLNPIFI